MSDPLEGVPKRTFRDRHNGQLYLVDADHRAAWNDFKKLHPQFTPGRYEQEQLLLHFYAAPIPG